ncbi:hypothetical protein DSO57_1011226 [Entomophthora muscae]|uniref:Uncharacterized protein n=1 Tax=Entomophthora muscae TaxID=34485 RepID=A0ACC2S821_9FUNG|nr:hypothetical protein DSO57_1011226 [Entomophthora muscae]
MEYMLSLIVLVSLVNGLPQGPVEDIANALNPDFNPVTRALLLPLTAIPGSTSSGNGQPFGKARPIETLNQNVIDPSLEPFKSSPAPIPASSKDFDTAELAEKLFGGLFEPPKQTEPMDPQELADFILNAKIPTDLSINDVLTLAKVGGFDIGGLLNLAASPKSQSPGDSANSPLNGLVANLLGGKSSDKPSQDPLNLLAGLFGKNNPSRLAKEGQPELSQFLNNLMKNQAQPTEIQDEFPNANNGVQLFDPSKAGKPTSGFGLPNADPPLLANSLPSSAPADDTTPTEQPQLNTIQPSPLEIQTPPTHSRKKAYHVRSHNSYIQ